MNTYCQDRRSLGNILPVAGATGISVVLGIGKALSAGHTIMAAFHGSATGPVSLFALGSADFVVGLVAFVAGMAFILRRGWGQWLLMHGGVAIAAYELGRALGLTVAEIITSDATALALSATTVASWVLVTWCARSKGADLYIASRTS